MIRDWSRRAVLRTGISVAVAGLTGCEAPSGGTTEPPGPNDIAFEASLGRGFTSGHPAEVRLGVRNVSDRTCWFGGGTVLPLTAYRSVAAGGSGELYLVPREHDHILPANEEEVTDTSLVPDEPVNGCWSIGFEEWRVAGLGSIVRIDPGDAIEGDYVLLDGTDNGCLPAREYVFREDHGLYRSLDRNVSSTVRLELSVTIGGTWQVENVRAGVKGDEPHGFN